MKQQTPIRLKSLLVCASLATSLAACAAPAATPVSAPTQPAALAPTTAPTIPKLAIDFTGTAFKLPAELPGGIVSITLNNTSGKPMDISLNRLRPGKTADEILKWYKETPEDYAGGFKIVSSIASFDPIAPGQSEHVVADLKTGEFILDAIDHIDGAPPPDAHYITQMFKADKVVGVVEPKADVTAEMQDFAFVMPDEVKAGKQTWKVINTGKQWHMLLIGKPDEGTTPDAVIKSLMDDTRQGPPPASIVGGISPISEGEQQWIELDLQPGTYVVVCPAPDFSVAGGPPVSHLMHGMHKTLVVK